MQRKNFFSSRGIGSEIKIFAQNSHQSKIIDTVLFLKRIKQAKDKFSDSDNTTSMERAVSNTEGKKKYSSKAFLFAFHFMENTTKSLICLKNIFEYMQSSGSLITFDLSENSEGICNNSHILKLYFLKVLMKTSKNTFKQSRK